MVFVLIVHGIARIKPSSLTSTSNLRDAHSVKHNHYINIYISTQPGIVEQWPIANVLLTLFPIIMNPLIKKLQNVITIFRISWKCNQSPTRTSWVMLLTDRQTKCLTSLASVIKYAYISMTCGAYRVQMVAPCWPHQKVFWWMRIFFSIRLKCNVV